MSEENIIIDITPETTTKFQQTKTKVAEFVKRNKKTILLTAGSTVMVGLGAAVLSTIKKDDDSEPYLTLDFSDDASELIVADPTSGDSWLYGELNSEDGSEDVIIDSEDSVTESTE